MAEPKGKKSPNQKRHRKAVVQQVLSPEEAAKLKAAIEKAELERKAEAERLANWGKSVETMDQRQLHGEVKRLLRQERTKVGKGVYEPIAGLTVAFATIFDTVLTTTKTKENPFGRLSCYVR